MALRKPIKIGKYEVVDLLGKGGMGVVYKATDPFLGRSVAIKMMTTVDYGDSPDLLQRFYREAQSTGNLHHRNIVTVYELGDQEGSPYLVMEYLEGETLDAVIHSQKPLSLLDRINFILEVCDGLAYAHQRSVVHRDIKPGNIMVLKDSGVKIVDFGIAHIGNRTVTRTGQLLGSLPYMSPEQISAKQVDARTDIFSLGVVFYQLLTSHLPFEGETPAATLLKIMHERPRPLAEYKQSFPPELDTIILRALAKDREERYATAQDFAFDLVQIRGRIQQEIVEEHLSEAESLVAREELLKAREKLNEVLKIDRHNTRGVELSRTILQRLQQQEMGEQVRQLRGQAEDAFQKEQFAQALELIQKAINLHTTDPDLLRFRSSVQQAKTKADQLQKALQRAELAYEQGELDSAKQAIEEALALSPDDVHAKSIHRAIQRDWAQRAQRLQVQNLIDEARKEIASRNFTLALEVLRKAEAIDPGAPQLQALIDAAKGAREQEQRRKALEIAKREIESDLDRDDFQVACTKAEAALQQFPDDRGLQKLKDLAEKQRTLAERKYFVEEQVSRARKLLEAGKTEEVLELLHAAQQKVGGDPHLDSLLIVVRETLERQRTEARKVDFLRRAKDQLRVKQYADAISILEAAQSELGSNPEIDDLLQFTIEQQNAEERRLVADAAAERAQQLVKDQDYEKAVEVLEAALQEAPDEELRIILVQARHAAADHRKLLEDALANTESMIQGQRPVEALKYLQSQPSSFSRDPRFVDLLQKAGQQAERLKRVEQALERARVHVARDEFESARAVLDECVRNHGRTLELNKLIAEIEQREMQIVADTLEKALSEGRALMSHGKPDQALDRLDSVQTIVGMVSPKLSNAYQALQQEAANAKARKYKADVEQLLVQGAHDEAAQLLQRALKEFPQNRDLQLVSKTFEQAARRRAEAVALCERAQEFFGRQSWREGADACLRAAPLSARDPVVRGQIVSILEASAAIAVDSDWRHADNLLQSMAQVQPNATPPAALLEKITRAKQEESIHETLQGASEAQSRGNIDGALRIVNDALVQHQGESRLTKLRQSLQNERGEKEKRLQLERERHQKEAYIVEVQQALQRDLTHDGRIRILTDALRKYPGEPVFETELAEAQACEAKAQTLAQEAKHLEASRNYDGALQKWAAVAELGVFHPDSEPSIARLRRLQEEARTAARTAWAKAIRDSLAAFDLDSAGALLVDALREFPADQELKEIASLRDRILPQRELSLAQIRKAQEELKALRWQSASESIRLGLQSGAGDPAVSSAALKALLDGSRAALPVDLPTAENFLEQAARIQPHAPDVVALRVEVERQAREAIVKRHLADAKAVAKAGNAERALSNLNDAYSNFPDEPRFLALKQELERDIQFEKDAQDKRNRLLEMLDAAQHLRSEGNLAAALKKIDEGLSVFPGHSQFTEMKRSIEIAIRDQKEREQREEKQRQQKLEEENKSQRAERQRLEEEQKLQQQAEEKARRAAAEEERRKQKEAWDRKAREEAEKKQRAAENVTRISDSKKQVRTSAHQEAPVWRGAALPVEAKAPQPEVLPAARSVQPAPAAQTAIARPESPHRKIYLAAAAAFVIVAALLTPMLWKTMHRPAAASAIPVQIVTNPPGASVRVSDSGQSCVTPQCTINLPPGEHELQVDLAGYQHLTKSISVGQAEANPFSLSLIPVPPAAIPPAAAPPQQQDARLDLRNAPAGAGVLVDKQEVGKVGRRGTFSAAVSPGNHEIQLLAQNRPSTSIQRDFASGAQVGLSGNDFPSPAATPKPEPGNIEQSEWLKIKDSQDIQVVDDFLSRHPKGELHVEAQGKLEDLYWAKAANGGGIAAYNQYLSRFPGGRYSNEAQNQIANLEWSSLENSSDIAALEAYLKKYPSSSYHQKAQARVDDLAWQHTPQDASGLRSYLGTFPEGRHADEARKKIDSLNHSAIVSSSNEPRPTEVPSVNDNKAILEILGLYQKAYETENLDELKNIWPGMTGPQITGLGDFFRQATGLSLQYQVRKIEINGDHATVSLTQSIKYAVDGRPGKNSAKIVMQLNRLQGSPGTWRIDSIR